jgi:asparagine synthase (glutamine-hydrolysing)
MCGIAGFNFGDRQAVERMIDAMRHRGPDDRGLYVDGRVSLGHSRLSILDLSPCGHQPMERQGRQIVFNGEIYNFRELRRELEGCGYTFTSGTDTEVVLAGYDRWGQECVERFNGMWALGIYDPGRGELVVSRDRFGVKPLYYYFDGERFAFASELKAIRCLGLGASLDRRAVNYFFYQHYIGGELTIFERCFKLPPGENLVFNLDRRTIVRRRWWDLEERVAEQAAQGLKGRLEAVEGLVVDSVRQRLVADVPVGSFLSGGLDSSLISAVAAKDRRDFATFSIGFHERSYDEVPFSRAAAEHIGTRHHVEYLDMDEGLIDSVLRRTDEPFGDSSLLPTYLLSKMTRQHVTVALSGDGGDEVFGGYDTYLAHRIARWTPRAVARLLGAGANLLPPSDRKVTLAFKVGRFARDIGRQAVRRHLDWMATFGEAARRELLGEAFVPAEEFCDFAGGDDLLSVQINDIRNYLAEDILKKVDTASMLNSLEARTPLLDYRLVPLVLSLPERFKVRRLRVKWLLKRIAERWLPRRIVHRAKRGFTVPVSRWIKSSDLVRQALSEKAYYAHGLVDRRRVQAMLDAHLAGAADSARPLWMVFVFNHWWRNNG